MYYKACTKHVQYSTLCYKACFKALPGTTLYYKACTKLFRPVLLCTTKGWHKARDPANTRCTVLGLLIMALPSSKFVLGKHKFSPSAMQHCGHRYSCKRQKYYKANRAAAARNRDAAITGCVSQHRRGKPACLDITWQQTRGNNACGFIPKTKPRQP